MKELMSKGCWAVVFAFLSCVVVMGQESKDPWVNEIASPFYFAMRVEDVDRSVEWYGQVFGLTGAGGSEADDGSWRIENLTNDRLMVEIIRDDRAQEVERATGERPRSVEFEPLGIRLIQIRDPDGNVIQLSSPLELQD